MTASPKGYRAPAKCADCKAPSPAFVRERSIPGSDRRQAEFQCAGCGLVHAVADSNKPTKGKAKGGDS